MSKCIRSSAIPRPAGEVAAPSELLGQLRVGLQRVLVERVSVLLVGTEGARVLIVAQPLPALGIDQLDVERIAATVLPLVAGPVAGCRLHRVRIVLEALDELQQVLIDIGVEGVGPAVSHQ
jgi:hypothetical protein